MFCKFPNYIITVTILYLLCSAILDEASIAAAAAGDARATICFVAPPVLNEELPPENECRSLFPQDTY